MQLICCALSGQTFAVGVEPEDTTDGLATLIEDVTGTPPDQQKLVIAGAVLESGYSLSHYSAHEGAR
eukprot:4439857-Alexandrium_andersonii.AAC.1